MTEAARPESAVRAARRQAPLVLAVLSALLIGAYVWWRIAAQYAGAEQFWTEPLAASADTYRARAVSWLDARRDAGALLASLLADDGARTPAFSRAAATALRKNGVELVTLRVGTENTRCVLSPDSLRTVCVPGTMRYAIPSPEHAQARRVRPMGDGRLLVPVVTAIGGDPGVGVLTQWIDPEAALIPALLRARGSMPGTSTTFVRRDGNVAIVTHADSGANPQPSRRFDVAALPGLLARPPLEGELTRGADPDGIDAIGAAAYIPLLRWHVYRSISRESAFAAFRAELITEGLLAFLLGSFVFGLFVWTFRERRHQQMHAALVQARLDSLQAQLRPHFLFNALNTIATLVHENVDAAERMLVRLAELLRLSLEESEHALITVQRELELLDAFLELERVRFGADLRVTTHTGSGVSDLLVPRWVLQPLVENAIKHGGAYTRGEASISVALLSNDGRLIIVVADDGPRVAGAATSEGVGLRNTRQRLDSLFGSRASLTLRHLDIGGTEAIMEIPARRGSASSGAQAARRTRAARTPA